jgi:hypothetical protein
MGNRYKIGHNYKDILSVSRERDQFVSWFSLNGSGIGNSGGIRAAKYISNINTNLPAYLVLITRNISHRWYNPWEDTIDYSTGSIYYWGDAKFDSKKSYSQFRGNKHLLITFEKILENRVEEVPPILHFSKIERGLVKFNGLCALTDLDLTWFEDKGNPVKNYRCELAILDAEEIELEWLHHRAKCNDPSRINDKAPKVWKDYIKGNTRKLDVWAKSVLSKDEQLPANGTNEELILTRISQLTPTQFEAFVVELFKNLPHVNHKIVRTRPTADGGFDFYGQFSIPYPVRYEIDFLGEAKKFSRSNAVQPKHVSRLVARLGRGQFGVFVTTSYYTKQTQREVLEDGYPVKLFSGNDIVNMLQELRLVKDGKISNEWMSTVIDNVK